MTLHDEKAEVVIECCWLFALVLVDLCFRMVLQDDTA